MRKQNESFLPSLCGCCRQTFTSLRNEASKGDKVHMTEEARKTMNDYQRKWRKANQEKLKEYRIRYREKSRECKRKWRAANPEKTKEYQKRYWEKKVKSKNKKDDQ